MTEYNLTQVHDQPTREQNMLDLTFTTNPSLIKSTANAPGISDHAMVVTDTDIKPIYIRQKPRKVFILVKPIGMISKSDCDTLAKLNL